MNKSNNYKLQLIKMLVAGQIHTCNRNAMDRSFMAANKDWLKVLLMNPVLVANLAYAFWHVSGICDSFVASHTLSETAPQSSKIIIWKAQGVPQ